MDASKTGLGGVLFQLVDCEPGTVANVANQPSMGVIMFISKKLADAETLNTTTELEALAVVRCLAEVRWLVLGAKYPTKVYTDHLALIMLLKHDDAHGRIGKWQVKLAEYNRKYVHVPGSQNVIADRLSRLPARYFDKWNDDPAKINNREGVGTGVEDPLGGGKTELGMVAVISMEERERWG